MACMKDVYVIKNTICRGLSNEKVDSAMCIASDHATMKLGGFTPWSWVTACFNTLFKPS